jgi:hypothetical protein
MFIFQKTLMYDILKRIKLEKKTVTWIISLLESKFRRLSIHTNQLNRKGLELNILINLFYEF